MALKRLLNLLAEFCAGCHLGCSMLDGDDSGHISLPQQCIRIGYVACDESEHGRLDVVGSIGAVGSSPLSGSLVATGAQRIGKDNSFKLN